MIYRENGLFSHANLEIYLEASFSYLGCVSEL